MNDENLGRLAMQTEIERDITPGLPKAERAIAFVRTRGTATSSELHMVMELEPDEMVSHHLADALADGRLIKNGRHWTIGAGPAKQEYAVPSFVPPQDDNVVPIAAPRMARVKETPKIDFASFADMVNSQPANEAPSPAPVIRCGLWSDGSVEVQRDGKTTAVLFVEEVAHLADFWKRVSATAKEAM